MNLQTLIADFDVASLLSSFASGEWQVRHGPIHRFPEFLRPDEGDLSCIQKLQNWPRFQIGYIESGEFRQTREANRSPLEHYEAGAVVTSRSIEEMSDAAGRCLEEWSQKLGVSRAVLRLNSWAARAGVGVGWHFDPEDVIHFQIKGDKLLKLLRAPATRYADEQTKRFERILASQQNFDEAAQEVITEGTITVIPRGVWHATEARGDESFAVSLCISQASRGLAISQALYRKLRLTERYRAPLYGASAAQREAIESCLGEASTLLGSMTSGSVLSHDTQALFSLTNIDAYYFYVGRRSRARLAPVRMWVDGKELQADADQTKRDVIEALCSIGAGFRALDLRKRVPDVAPGIVAEVLSSLVEVGFLDFVDGSPWPSKG